MRPPTSDTPGEVAAISTAVGQLADGLAAMVLAGPWHDNAVVRRPSDRTAAAARMSRLRTVPDGSRVDACHDCSVWALFDDFASHDHPLARLQHCSDVCCPRAAHHHVHNHADERADGRHCSQRLPVFGAGRAGSTQHGRTGRGSCVRDRRGAIRQADWHALRADPTARGRPSRLCTFDAYLH